MRDGERLTRDALKGDHALLGEPRGHLGVEFEVVGRGEVRLERGLVVVDLVEEYLRAVGGLADVELPAARLVRARGGGVLDHGLAKGVPMLGPGDEEDRDHEAHATSFTAVDNAASVARVISAQPALPPISIGAIPPRSAASSARSMRRARSSSFASPCRSASQSSIIAADRN